MVLYYLPGAARLPARATLPMRPDEKGSPLVFSGQIRDVDGGPISGAEIDIWQADDDGFYSGFAPHLPEGNLRGLVVTGDDGGFGDPYDPAGAVPDSHGRADRQADRRCGMAPVAPCASAPDRRCPGHRAITTQLYFRGGEWLDSDVAQAVKPELILDPQEQDDGSRVVTYNFVLEPTQSAAA